MQKIFGLGFSKTGTTSLETALETLGYNVCRGNYTNTHTHYLQALIVNQAYDEIFRMVNYWDAFADTPWGGTTLYKEIYARLPDSKFILTVRDAEKWYASLIKLLTMFDLNLETAFDSYHSNGLYGSHYFFKHVFGIETLAGTKQRIIDYYNAYNRDVIDFFAERNVKLLVLNFEKGDGWPILCKFLGKQIPHRPFPHDNQAIQNSYLSNAVVTKKRNVVVYFHLGRPGDFESAGSIRQSLAQFDRELIEIPLADQVAATAALKAVLSERGAEIFCFLSDNYVAAQITGANGLLLHEVTGIPLITMMRNHPVHFLAKQTPKLRGTISFVPGDDARAFITARYPPNTLEITNTGSLPPVVAERPDLEQFMSRKNAILAPLSLNLGDVTLDHAWQRIESLPAARRAVAKTLAEAALTDCVTPLHEIASAQPNGLSDAETTAAIGDQLLVLTFVELWRRNQMIRALIDLPILIGSEFVPDDLQAKHAEKFTPLPFAQTVQLLREYRFSLNANGLLTDLLHDTLVSATALNSVCITDANAAVKRYFHDGLDAIFFDYSKIEEMPQRIAGYLEDPARAFEVTVRAAALRDASDGFDYREGYRNLMDAVDAHWARITVTASP